MEHQLGVGVTGECRCCLEKRRPQCDFGLSEEAQGTTPPHHHHRCNTRLGTHLPFRFDPFFLKWRSHLSRASVRGIRAAARARDGKRYEERNAPAGPRDFSNKRFMPDET
ncbi:hypothetical protein SKAU_G00033240 [Synaphobranchus kaupii]|uniref:Uncharacterized protein n=1 Tax=Synaphobranchus kaupii TaxID=118154 RepID=A0A9Q1GE28_SYNKA|nr:hypothetical protein SKAU_G00033240 [Synaphobranchus kaupii]